MEHKAASTIDNNNEQNDSRRRKASTTTTKTNNEQRRCGGDTTTPRHQSDIHGGWLRHQLAHQWSFDIPLRTSCKLQPNYPPTMIFSDSLLSYARVAMVPRVRCPSWPPKKKERLKDGRHHARAVRAAGRAACGPTPNAQRR